MPRKVAILGCGPAALASAKAALDSGYRVLIASASDQPSTQYGCQYLHAPVPGYENVRHTRVEYRLNGTPDQYRRKVYGEKWPGKVSPEDFIGDHDAWDIRETYRRMWTDLHKDKRVTFQTIIRIGVGFIPGSIIDFIPEFLISTIPAPALCYMRGHNFLHHVIYANGSIEPMLERSGLEDEIICDGTPENDWYRIATVFGYRTTEWSTRPADNGLSVVAVPKPLKTDCDCHQEVYRIGRYGKWSKGYLVHQAYPEVMEILN
jgi:hypothetical protein